MIRGKKTTLICFFAFIFIWLFSFHIPFLSKFNTVFFISFITLCGIIMIEFKVFNHVFEMNLWFILFLSITIFSSLYNGFFFNQKLWTTVFLSIFFSYIASQREMEGDVVLILFYAFNSVAFISFLVALLANHSNLIDSPSPIITNSLFNAIQNGRIYGILDSPNQLGQITAISILISIFCIARKFGNKKNIIINIILIIFNCYLLIGTKSRASYLGLCFALFTFVLFKQKRNRLFWLVFFLLIGTLFIIFLTINIQTLETITNRSWVTGSGRVEIWKSAAKLITLRPVWGYGALDQYTYLDATIDKHGTHNIFIEIAILYGIPASFIFLWSLAVIFKRIAYYFINRQDFSENNLLLTSTLLVFCIINNQFETNILFSISPLQAIFLYSFLYSDRKTNSALKNVSLQKL